MPEIHICLEVHIVQRLRKKYLGINQVLKKENDREKGSSLSNFRQAISFIPVYN